MSDTLPAPSDCPHCKLPPAEPEPAQLAELADKLDTLGKAVAVLLDRTEPLDDLLPKLAAMIEGAGAMLSGQGGGMLAALIGARKG